MTYIQFSIFFGVRSRVRHQSAQECYSRCSVCLDMKPLLSSHELKLNVEWQRWNLPSRGIRALRILTQEIDKTFFNYDIFGGEMEIAFQQKICWWELTWNFWWLRKVQFYQLEHFYQGCLVEEISWILLWAMPFCPPCARCHVQARWNFSCKPGEFKPELVTPKKTYRWSTYKKHLPPMCVTFVDAFSAKRILRNPEPSPLGRSHNPPFFLFH